MTLTNKLFCLENRTALVAGACGNIGRAICRSLAAQGARVLVSDVDSEASAAFAAELGGASLPVDWSDEAQVRAASEALTKLAPEVHIAVHGIGLISSVPIPGYAVPFAQQTLEAWNLALNVNLTSAFLFSKCLERHLVQDGKGSVIFLSSIYGSVGPDMGLYEGTGMDNPVAYGASKGGLQQLARYLATQWAPAVRVNCVSPGGIQRAQPEMFIKRYEARTPMKRMARPEDVAGPVAFLASDAARYVTGQNLLVDGGWTAW